MSAVFFFFFFFFCLFVLFCFVFLFPVAYKLADFGIVCLSCDIKELRN